MVKIKVDKVNDSICEVKVSGHAGYSESGKDIVCAAVSSIVTTTVNAILRLEEEGISYSESEGLVDIKVNTSSDIVEKLLINMIELLADLEKQYKKFIKIY